MAFADKILTCKDCGKDFTFTAREQAFYAEKGFDNEPGRCPDCRKARKQSRNNHRNSGGRQGNKRPLYDTVCSACGRETKVPFKPTGERPVYCRDCFEEHR